MHPNTETSQMELFVTALCAQLTTITHTFSTWMHADSPTLAQVEQHVLPLLKEIGMALVTGLCQFVVPAQPDPTVPCACGQSARYVRLRPAQVTTLLGPITLHRPYYHCAACGQGQHPLDATSKSVPAAAVRVWTRC